MSFDLSRCMSVCVCMYVTNISWCRTSSYVAVTLVLIAQLNCWRNSTPFRCKASLCTIRIDNFRTYHDPKNGVEFFRHRLEVTTHTGISQRSQHYEHNCTLFNRDKILHFPLKWTKLIGFNHLKCKTNFPFVDTDIFCGIFK